MSQSSMKFADRRKIAIVALSLVCWVAQQEIASAQNGRFLQGIYQTIVEAQAERDRLEALSRAQAGPSLAPPRNGTPQSPSVPAPPPSNPAVTANWFLDSVTVLRQNVSRLAPELRRYAPTTPAVREALNEVYQIEAETNSLYSRVRNGESIASTSFAYQEVDTRWRDVAYRIRAGGRLDPNLAVLIDAVDESFRQIDRKLGVSQPIDRVRLRDLMIVTLTYMDAMFDDIRLTPSAFTTSESLIREGRILRERLRLESYKIDRADYNTVVGSYTEFVQQWRTYAAKLYKLNDPHVNQRLDSIRKQGEEVYATLRIPVANDRGQVLFACQRLSAGLVSLHDQMARWGTGRLPADQLRFAETVRTLIDRGRQLETEAARNGASRSAASLFTTMDAAWVSGLRSMKAVDPRSGLQQLLVQVDALFGEVRNLLGATPWQGQSELLSAAASLEVAADDFNIDAQRYKRYLVPTEFRDQFASASDAFYHVSTDLHRALEANDNLQEATRQAELMVQHWQTLTPLVNELVQRGLAPNRADPLFEGYRQMQPLVAQVASTLLN